MTYFSAFKRKEILIHVITWMNFEHITLGEISSTQKNKYSMIPLTLGGPYRSQIQ